MKAKMSTLTYSLVPNTLSGQDGCHAVVSHVDTTGEDAFYGRVAARRAGLDAATARLTMEAVLTAAAEILAERQYRVSLGNVSFELAIPGSTDSIDGTPAEGAYVAIRPDAVLRNAAAGISPVFSDDDGVKTEILLVEDIETRAVGQINGTKPFRITGANLSATGNGESVKVKAANGTEAEAEVTDEDGTGHHMTARLASALAPGKGTVTVTTRGLRTPEGDLRPFVKKVEIIAGDVPPTPTGPTVTAINDGTFHTGAGNVVTGVGMRFADEYPCGHVVIRNSSGDDMEAMISDDTSVPRTETTFALSIDEGTPLTVGEEYTFEFEMLDDDDEPVTVTHTARWRAA